MALRRIRWRGRSGMDGRPAACFLAAAVLNPSPVHGGWRCSRRVNNGLSPSRMDGPDGILEVGGGFVSFLGARPGSYPRLPVSDLDPYPRPRWSVRRVRRSGGGVVHEDQEHAVPARFGVAGAPCGQQRFGVLLPEVVDGFARGWFDTYAVVAQRGQCRVFEARWSGNTRIVVILSNGAVIPALGRIHSSRNAWLRCVPSVVSSHRTPRCGTPRRSSASYLGSQWCKSRATRQKSGSPELAAVFLALLMVPPFRDHAFGVGDYPSMKSGLACTQSVDAGVSHAAR